MICHCRSTIREKIIPHAVSWFTGEAVPIDDEEEEQEVEEDDDGDDEEEEYYVEENDE